MWHGNSNRLSGFDDRAECITKKASGKLGPGFMCVFKRVVNHNKGREQGYFF